MFVEIKIKNGQKITIPCISRIDSDEKMIYLYTLDNTDVPIRANGQDIVRTALPCFDIRTVLEIKVIP